MTRLRKCVRITSPLEGAQPSQKLRQSCLFAVAITLALPSIGCKGIQQNENAGFLKRLAASSPSSFGSGLGSVTDERRLCIETAKMVAQRGHSAEAIKLYEKAEQLDPTGDRLDAKLAPLYVDVGDIDAAIARYKACRTRDPKDVDLANNFAWTLMECGRFDQALAEANRGLQVDPDHSRLRTTLAMIHYRSGNQQEALRHFEKALGPAAAHHNLAVLDLDAGNVTSAKTHLNLAAASPDASVKTDALLAELRSQTTVR